MVVVGFFADGSFDLCDFFFFIPDVFFDHGPDDFALDAFESVADAGYGSSVAVCGEVFEFFVDGVAVCEFGL